VVHAWQGGGTLAIELSDRSDNTFRIFDYGRELDPFKRRRMHHLEAMYSLVPETILSPGDEQRYISSPSAKAEQWHPLLQARLRIAVGEAGWTKLRRTAGYSFVMNPDGPVHLRAGSPNHLQLLLGPCRTGLIGPDVHATAYLERTTDRLIEFWPAKPCVRNPTATAGDS
jgi:hypothetical protein